MKYLLICLCLLVRTSLVQAASLKIDLGHGTRRYDTTTLLHDPRVQTIEIPNDVAFQKTMRYRAITLNDLLAGLLLSDTVQFVATDGFTAEIPAALLLGQRHAQAWLAIEDPAQPWPKLPGSHGNAGPFYLVWTHPETAGITTEQWPYQLTEIHRTGGDIGARFPAIVPGDAGGVVQQGLLVFQRTCFACHTLNGQGDSHLGPDLNIPHNPTEYLRPDLLRAFIRDPQSLYRWPQAKMHGFPTEQSLSEADLNALLAYLNYMAKHKTAL